NAMNYEDLKSYDHKIDHVDETVKDGNRDVRPIKFDQKDKIKVNNTSENSNKKKLDKSKSEVNQVLATKNSNDHESSLEKNKYKVFFS
ncbi:25284_t:CDS:2, partial [Racocetra persica]